MGIMETLAGLFRRRSGKDGIWDYLGKRSADKSRVELEKVRNDGTQRLIPLLKPGMVLIEGGSDWFREIRSPDELPSGMLFTSFASSPVVPPLPVAEPESASRSELEPAPQIQAGQEQGPAEEPH
jgi:hypothetical protein